MLPIFSIKWANHSSDFRVNAKHETKDAYYYKLYFKSTKLWCSTAKIYSVRFFSYRYFQVLLKGQGFRMLGYKWGWEHLVCNTHLCNWLKNVHWHGLLYLLREISGKAWSIMSDMPLLSLMSNFSYLRKETGKTTVFVLLKFHYKLKCKILKLTCYDFPCCKR